MDTRTFNGTKRTKTMISCTNGVEEGEENFNVEEISDDRSDAWEVTEIDSGEEESYFLLIL